MVSATLGVSFVLTGSLTFGHKVNVHKLAAHVFPVSSDLMTWMHGARVIAKSEASEASSSEARDRVQSEDAKEAKVSLASQGERKLITLTAEELKQYDGSDPSKPIYLAIKGRVYDVSAGEQYYGKNGGYKFFAGVDAARAYITGCFETHLIPDLRGLSETEIESLSSWTDFYEKHDKYFYVGQVIHDPIPEDAPLPAPCR
ncbi:cytochrome b5 [Rhizoclosmatium globosum]|uniref:Cytochrome b5 n=1 Tax=Rhizoclosmatium globosum TaxID=329046 RepID=A0A1Y2C8Q4_9FUNG|nr:cytochrome b5 [Rhizoclosmatium globosum]|eukprot:ORY43412.1 cytochrome b5 [Rhizoclosmatium globosum]